MALEADRPGATGQVAVRVSPLLHDRWLRLAEDVGQPFPDLLRAMLEFGEAEVRRRHAAGQPAPAPDQLPKGWPASPGERQLQQALLALAGVPGMDGIGDLVQKVRRLCLGTRGEERAERVMLVLAAEYPHHMLVVSELAALILQEAEENDRRAEMMKLFVKAGRDEENDLLARAAAKAMPPGRGKRRTTPDYH